ncbi:DNA polymerase III subunit epsilon [Rhodobacterales bacterium HKCCE2091]|nr:DNA polymerase III subunit epsilon [Rhodobacterales bacterium HKCCE2091]
MKAPGHLPWLFRGLGLRLRMFLLFAALAFAAAAAVAAGLLFGYSHATSGNAPSGFILAGVSGVIVIVGLITWLWTRFDDNVARPLERLATDLRAHAHAGDVAPLDPDAGPYLGDIVPAAVSVTAALAETRGAMAEAVARETRKLGQETARLTALLAEIGDGVLFCGPDHRVVLYNGQVRAVLGDPAGLGLNRRVGDVLVPEPIEEAYARLRGAGAREGEDLLLTTAQGSRLIEARMRLMWTDTDGDGTGDEDGNGDAPAPGYVLSLRDVSADLGVAAERARLLEDAIALGRDAVARLPDAGGELAARLDAIAARKAPTDTRWWPMEALAASDLGAALQARLARKGVALGQHLPDMHVRCDGFAVTRLLERLALDWAGSGARDLSLSLEEAGDGVRLMLTAAGDLPDDRALARTLDTPISPGESHFAGRDVLLSHGTDLLRGDGLGLVLARAEPKRQLSRVVEYDFDLLDVEIPADLAAGLLSRLSFVVFDTETTGLDPARDEVCQIAAVRVVNGRVVEGETFDMLVNPGRPIPPGATAIHGLSDAMVSDAPEVEAAVERFHAYAAGSVLVAHNAPFDMAFLKRREAAIGARFDQPILDTVLLSAILYGQTEDHTLDGVCARLGVVIPEDARHTAIGDAIATAQALRRMIPVLASRGLSTLGETIAAFDRHRRVIEHLN